MSGTAMAGIDKTLSIMPFFNITNRELFQDVLFELESVKENICENTVFYNNLISTSNNDLLKQLQFAYCTDTEFNNLLCSKDVRNIELSIFHLNIRSLNRNHRGLIHLLQLIDHNFDVIVLSEIWKYNLEFYRSILKSYIFYYVEPQNSNVGGVGMFIKNKFNCVELNNFNLPSTSTAMVESLWLELTCDSKKYIVGAIYRHPNKNIRDFHTHLECILERVSISNIPCIIAGDFNIDFVKYSLHLETTDYVNSLLLNNFLPVIYMPTRITTKSAT